MSPYQKSVIRRCTKITESTREQDFQSKATLKQPVFIQPTQITTKHADDAKRKITLGIIKAKSMSAEMTLKLICRGTEG